MFTGKKSGDMSNLQTGKDTNIMRKIYQSSLFYDKNAFRKQQNIHFTVSAVRNCVCEGCPIHPHRNGPYKPCVDPYGSTTGVYGL